MFLNNSLPRAYSFSRSRRTLPTKRSSRGKFDIEFPPLLDNLRENHNKSQDARLSNDHNVNLLLDTWAYTKSTQLLTS